MKLTVNQIINTQAGLSKIAKTRMPAGVGLKIALILQALDAALELIWKQRNELLETHGTPIPEKAGQFTFAPEKRKVYEDAAAGLGKTEVDLPLVTGPVSLPAFIELAPEDLLAAQPLVVVPDA